MIKLFKSSKNFIVHFYLLISYINIFYKMDSTLGQEENGYRVTKQINCGIYLKEGNIWTIVDLFILLDHQGDVTTRD